MDVAFDTRSDPHMNSPMDTSIIDNVSGFIEVNSVRAFQLDYSQYIELIRASYETTCSLDMEFERYLSFGAFQYYFVILLWCRLFIVLSSSGINTAQVLALREILNFNLPVPPDVEAYLYGIGDLKDVTGRDYHISIQGSLTNLKINGAQGTYGAIDNDNMIIYETLRSPLISLLKILADMFPDEENHAAVWHLPRELDPGFGSDSRPTENLLGWWPREILTLDQKLMFANSGITPSTLNVVNIGFIPINTILIRQIADKLELFGRSMTMTTIPMAERGSISQIPFTSRVMEDTTEDLISNIAGKLGNTNCYIPMPKSIVSASAIFRYRIKRYEEGTEDMLAYWFDDYKRKQILLANENRIFQFGAGGELWNRNHVRLSAQNGRTLVRNFSSKLRIRYRPKFTEYSNTTTNTPMTSPTTIWYRKK